MIRQGLRVEIVVGGSSQGFFYVENVVEGEPDTYLLTKDDGSGAQITAWLSEIVEDGVVKYRPYARKVEIR